MLIIRAGRKKPVFFIAIEMAVFTRLAYLLSCMSLLTKRDFKAIFCPVLLRLPGALPVIRSASAACIAYDGQNMHFAWRGLIRPPHTCNLSRNKKNPSGPRRGFACCLWYRQLRYPLSVRTGSFASQPYGWFAIFGYQAFVNGYTLSNRPIDYRNV
jgi:hypothetical protein